MSWNLYVNKKNAYFYIKSKNICDTRTYVNETITSPSCFLEHDQFELEKPNQRIELDDVLSDRPRLFGISTKWDSLTSLIKGVAFGVRSFMTFLLIENSRIRKVYVSR